MTTHPVKFPTSLFSKNIHQSLSSIAQCLFQPKKLVKMVTRFPMALNTNLVSKLCNRIFDEQIHEGDFDILKNRTVQISFSDANLSIAFSFDNNKIHCKHFSEIKNSADADLSIITADAIRLIKQEVDPDTLFFQRRLKISGDTELAHHIKNTVDTLNPELIPPVIMKLISDYQSRILVD